MLCPGSPQGDNVDTTAAVVKSFASYNFLCLLFGAGWKIVDEHNSLASSNLYIFLIPGESVFVCIF